MLIVDPVKFNVGLHALLHGHAPYPSQDEMGALLQEAAQNLDEDADFPQLIPTGTFEVLLYLEPSEEMYTDDVQVNAVLFNPQPNYYLADAFQGLLKAALRKGFFLIFSGDYVTASHKNVDIEATLSLVEDVDDPLVAAGLALLMLDQYQRVGRSDLEPALALSDFLSNNGSPAHMAA